MDEQLHHFLDLVRDGRALSAEQAAAATALSPSNLLDVMAVARIAASCGETKPFTCGIVNAKSGRCQENCSFCAQSGRHRTDVRAYPLLAEDEMLSRAERFAGAGVDYMGMVTSGTRPTEKDFDRLCLMGERISRSVGIKLCASLGILEDGQAKRLAASGFTSYHHNLETSRSYYPSVCTSHDYDLRTQTVRRAKEAGLRVCSGGIFGVGETWAHRVELSTELALLDVDSIPVNFLIPVPGTPLADAAPIPPGEALAVIALLRLMHPRRDIVVCGGRANLGRYMEMLFSAGANGVMVGDYLTTNGGPLADDMAMFAMVGVDK